jgi:hypothetical protein
MTAPNTQSTDGLLGIVKTRLLTFVPNQNIVGGDTRTLADRLGTYNAGGVAIPRMWFEKVPDDVGEDRSTNQNVWAMMQLIPAKQHGDDGRFMRRGELEVQIFGRPRRAAVEVSGMADCVEQALFAWLNHSTEGGYIKALGGLTRTKIVYDDPSDRELGEIDLRVNISYSPQFLTQYSSA